MPRLPAALLAALLVLPAAAQVRAQERIPSHCIALAEGVPGVEYLHRASLGAPIPADRVRLQYIDHAMFLLETPGGITVVTDYSGYIGPTGHVPTVVTMNRAHSTHFTHAPDPRIPHVLRGWNPEGGPIEHDLDLGEVLIRNVQTDIRGGMGGAVADGNSIFVFEAAGLCIGHLGHLHHEPDAAQYMMLGRMDVVMAPVDGGMTLDLPAMIRVLGRLRSSVVIPMHWFGEGSLQRFLTGMEGDFDVVDAGETSIELGLDRLPSRPTVMVLRPQFLE